MIYLACPYTHKDPAVMELRYQCVTRIAARFIKRGIYVYSPISHSHHMNLLEEIPPVWQTWEQYDLEMVSLCNRLYILALPGWDVSIGVSAEVAHANAIGMATHVVSPSRYPELFENLPQFEHLMKIALE